jgi:hypothetical protein
MGNDWSPGEGERVYIEEEARIGRIIACEPDGEDVVYLVELEPHPGQISVRQPHQLGYEPPDAVQVMLDELAPG